MENKKYVPNDVWKFSISLKDTDIYKSVYTKPLPDFYVDLTEKERSKYKDSNEYFNKQEDLVQEKYFTSERIQEYKDIFCKQIQESENPFYICCIDTDGGYNVTEDQLFNLE